MLITLAVLVCNGALCMEKIAGQNDQASLMSCWMQSQVIISDWKRNNPQYSDWTVKSYRCVSGDFELKREI